MDVYICSPIVGVAANTARMRWLSSASHRCAVSDATDTPRFSAYRFAIRPTAATIGCANTRTASSQAPSDDSDC